MLSWRTSRLLKVKWLVVGVVSMRFACVGAMIDEMKRSC